MMATGTNPLFATAEDKSETSQAMASLLVTGDVHLGRHPSRIPEDLDGPQFSPTQIWEDTVQEAIRRQVDAVVVTGDIVDRENRFFEAYGPLESGVTDLKEANIPLIAVAGNHDFDVLPRLAEEFGDDSVLLLGQEGTWETHPLELDSGMTLQFVGRSFPDQSESQSPLRDFNAPTGNGISIGVLHADLDAPNSHYGPVSTSDLLGTSLDAWLLGHIHTPGVRRDANPLILYPGSLQPLDPGERGPHGPWLLNVKPSGSIETTQLVSASLRYEEFSVALDESDDARSIPRRVQSEVQQRLDDETLTESLKLLLGRVTLRGRTEAHAELERERRNIEEELDFKAHGLPVRVERLDIQTQPAVDLEALADGSSPVSYLAKFLLDTADGQPDGDYRELIEDALEAMTQAYDADAYRDLRREEWVEPPSEADAVQTLRRQARLLLDTLLNQKRDQHAQQ